MPAAGDCPKNKHLSEKQSFEGKREILRTISQPRALSSDIPASQKGVYLFYNPLINFLHLQHVGRRRKTKTSANDAKKHIDWLIFLLKL